MLRVGEMRPLGEFPPAAFAHQRGQVAVEIGEEVEGPRLAQFLAHEEQRELRAEQQDRRQRVEDFRIG